MSRRRRGEENKRASETFVILIGDRQRGDNVCFLCADINVLMYIFFVYSFINALSIRRIDDTLE